MGVMFTNLNEFHQISMNSLIAVIADESHSKQYNKLACFTSFDDFHIKKFHGPHVKGALGSQPWLW